MSIRLTCPSCRAAFLASDEKLGREVECPKCGAPQTVPATVLEGPVDAPAAPAPLTDEHDDEPRRRRWLAPALLVLLPLLIVSALVAWPRIRDVWRPEPPKDPIERIASAYLEALVAHDQPALARLGTIAEPPAIRAFDAPRHDRAADRDLKGSFAPIAAFHAKVAEDYEYDPKISRFQPKNPLGPAAETLDALHAAKEKMEREKVYEKMASADLDEVVDSVTSFGTVLGALAEGALAPAKLIPTYAQLVEGAKPPLPPEAKELALDFANEGETWDALLKRSPLTLKADGPFRLERAEVTAPAVDALASSGDPPTLLRLTLTRFRLEGIDTGWRVTSARRVLADAPAAPSDERPTPPSPASPGDPASASPQ